MAVSMIGPKFYAWDRNGKPLAFGKLYTYQARTNIPKPTYQSEDQIVENTNPVILNGEGYANVYLDGSYKMTLKDSNDNEIWSSDPVTSQSANEWVGCSSVTYLSAKSFKLIGNYSESFEVGIAVRVNNSLLYSYSTVESSVFAGGETTVTLIDSIVETSVISACHSIVGPKSISIDNAIVTSTGATKGKSLADRFADIDGIVDSTYNIPGDFADWTELSEFLEQKLYGGTKIVVSIEPGIYQWETLPEIFGKEWGNGRVSFVGAGIDVTTIQFDKKDGVYAGALSSFGKGPQFPVPSSDTIPIVDNLTLSGIDRSIAIDDPYLDSMGIRAFDGGFVAIGADVRITQFARVGVMSERNAFVYCPGIEVDTTGSDCFAASLGGKIYCPNTVADNPLGHCYIGFSNGYLYMPNCVASNAELRQDGLGGSGLVLTDGSHARALNFQVTNCDERPISVALGSTCYAEGFSESGNGKPVTVAHAGSCLTAPNATIVKASGELALFVEKEGQATFQVSSTDEVSITGRVTIQGCSTVHMPDSNIINSIGTSLFVSNSTVDADRIDFSGSPSLIAQAVDGAVLKMANGTAEPSTGSGVLCDSAEVHAKSFSLAGAGTDGFRTENGGRSYLNGSTVGNVGRYSIFSDGLGSFTDAKNTVVQDAFDGYRCNNGGHIYGVGSSADGVYVGADYNPVINTPDAGQLTLIVK